MSWINLSPRSGERNPRWRIGEPGCGDVRDGVLYRFPWPDEDLTRPEDRGPRAGIEIASPGRCRCGGERCEIAGMGYVASSRSVATMLRCTGCRRVCPLPAGWLLAVAAMVPTGIALRLRDAGGRDLLPYELPRAASVAAPAPAVHDPWRALVAEIDRVIAGASPEDAARTAALAPAAADLGVREPAVRLTGGVEYAYFAGALRLNSDSGDASSRAAAREREAAAKGLLAKAAAMIEAAHAATLPRGRRRA